MNRISFHNRGYAFKGLLAVHMLLIALVSCMQETMYSFREIPNSYVQSSLRAETCTNSHSTDNDNKLKLRQ